MYEIARRSSGLGDEPRRKHLLFAFGNADSPGGHPPAADGRRNLCDNLFPIGQRIGETTEYVPE